MPNQNAINAPTPLTVTNGGTGLSTLTTAYGVVCAGTTATGNLQNAGAGTSGQILISNGASALPSFANPNTAGLSLFLIQTQTANNSTTIDFTTGISSTYNFYILNINGYTPVTTSTQLQMVVSINGGSSWIVTGYQSGLISANWNSSTWTNSSTTTSFLISNASSSSDKQGYEVTIIDGANTSPIKIVSQGINTPGTTTALQMANGSNTSSSINALRLQSSSGNISTGTFSLYGISK